MAGFINIGFGNIVNRDKIVAVVSPDAAPVKRMVQQGKEEKIVIDATQGRRTKAVLVTQEGFLVLSALQPDTIGKRLHAEKIIEEKGDLDEFSGAGKGTVVKELMKNYECYALSISATTRNPRPGEENGREYFFKTKEEFEELIRQDALYEYAQYVDNYYGTPKAYVEEQLAAGKDVILEIEVQGALKVKEKNPQALLLFVTPPSAEELKHRLIDRGTETMDVINDRMRRAAEESEIMDHYQYLVINDDLDTCVKEVHQLIQSEHLKVSENLDLVADIQKELKEMKGE